MAKISKYWIPNWRDYGSSIEWAVSRTNMFFINYNLISIEVAFKLFKIACPDTYASLRSPRYFDDVTKDVTYLLPGKFVKDVEKEWNNTVFPIIDDVWENKNNHKWDDFNTPLERVCKRYAECRKNFEEWLAEQYWNNIREVCKYGTEEQRKEYWSFMVTLKERIEIASKFYNRVEDILDEKVNGRRLWTKSLKSSER